jgi:hypothetical protein
LSKGLFFTFAKTVEPAFFWRVNDKQATGSGGNMDQVFIVKDTVGDTLRGFEIDRCIWELLIKHGLSDQFASAARRDDDAMMEIYIKLCVAKEWGMLLDGVDEVRHYHLSKTQKSLERVDF